MNYTEDDLRAALRLPQHSEADGRLIRLVHQLGEEDLPTDVGSTSAMRRHGRAVRWTLVAASVALIGLISSIVIIASGNEGRDETGSSPAPSSRGQSSVSAATSPRQTPIGETLGQVIATAVPYQSGQLVMSFRRDEDGAPAITSGVLHRNSSKITAVSDGSAPIAGPNPLRCGAHALDPGFHCGQDIGSIGTDRHAFLLVGYVVGRDVARIQIVVDGKTYRAGTAPWSNSPLVHAYWVPGPVLKTYSPKGSRIGTVGSMTAYDAKGNVVARADGAIAHG